MMKEIELLYSRGCPNHENVLKVLKRILDETGMEYKSKEIEVNSWEEAVSKGFLGSPTIKINDLDVEREERFFIAEL